MDKKILFAGVNVIAILALYASYFGNSFSSNSTITLTTTNNGSITPNAALDELIAGNIRFVTGNLNKKDLSIIRRQELYNYGQKPLRLLLLAQTQGCHLNCFLMRDLVIYLLFVLQEM